MFIEKKQQKICGKILFIISIFIFFSIMFSPLTSVLHFIDEFFTLGLIKNSFSTMIYFDSFEVHPPLYYIIIKVFLKILNLLHINYDIIYALKFISFLPYLIILLISGTKLKKEYGWLTTGLISFTLGVMSEFFIQYLTIRMYSWALLFLLISFIYLKEVMFDSNIKSWILFSLFSLSGIYTHYFVGVSVVIMYLLLLVYFVKNNVELIKNWFISTIFLIVTYSPWIPIFFNQLNWVNQDFWIPPMDLSSIMNCICIFYRVDMSFTYELATLLVLISLMLIYSFSYKQLDKEDNIYILMGILIFFGTFSFGVIASFLFRPILFPRYLIPCAAIFWVSISIWISKLKNNKLLIFLLIFIFLLGSFNLYNEFDESKSYYNTGSSYNTSLNNLDNNNSIIICIQDIEVMQFGTYFNKSKVYMFNKVPYGVSDKYWGKRFNIKHNPHIRNILLKNPNKKVYMIKGNWDNPNLVFNNTTQFNIASTYFYELKS